MFEDEARVLMILPREMVDRARALAGRSTTSMKMPVSLQIVFRALIEEGLKRPGEHFPPSPEEALAQKLLRSP